ncbi:MAG: TetR family transcriptional regulator [Jatrophihabitantaceae bacterium]
MSSVRARGGTTTQPGGSARKVELLEAAYSYITRHGLVGMSLRPLADAIGSSPRVLLFLFGSKDELIHALLARARADQLTMLAELDAHRDGGPRRAAQAAQGTELVRTALRVWQWLAAPDHRGLLALWAEGYARSLIDPTGPWESFARSTVEDWLDILAAAQPRPWRRTAAGRTERTVALAVLRGALLDLLATGDTRRTTAAVRAYFA